MPSIFRFSVGLSALIVALVTAGCTGRPALSEEAPLSFGFEIPESGRVSAGIFDGDGRLLRELLRGVSLEAGRHTLTWDGLDRKGRPMPPGSYEWRVLRTPGLVAEYITSLGIRPGTAPYDTWVGNHAGAASVAVDETGVYIAATGAETAPVLLKQSLDGTERLWTRGRGEVTTGRFMGGIKMAADGEGRLYMLQQNGLVQIIDPATGTLRTDIIGRGPDFGGGRSDWTARNWSWDILPEDEERTREGRIAAPGHRYGNSPLSILDLDAFGETIVTSHHERNIVRWLDPEDGSPRAEVTIPGPWGVAVGRTGEVYVSSGSSIFTVSPDGAPPVVFAADLTEPRRLSIDRSTGEVLVAEGAPSHQIKRFSPEGEQLAVYGRLGGRREGRYVPEDFLDVTALAADGAGGFLIAEERVAPRRVAHVSRTGEIVNEWYGGQPYYAWGAPDPRRPTRVWFNPGAWLTLAEIDPDNRTWRVIENYRQSALGGGLFAPVTGHRGRWHVLYRGDDRFLASESSPQVLRHDDNTGLRAVTMVSNDRATVEKAMEIAGFEGPAGSFRWIDHNGDGVPQPDEFEFSTSGSVPSGARSVSSAFDLLTVASGHDDGRAYVRVLSTAPEWRNGVPVYPFGDEPGINSVAGDVTVPHPAGTGGTRGVAAFRDAEGAFYALYNTGADWHGSSWPTYWGGQSRLVKWSPTGEERWRVGRHAIHGGLGGAPHTTPPGFIHVGAAIIGETHGTVVFADRVEWMGKVWTKDGLYVGNVLDGRVDDGLPDTVYYWWRTPDGEESIITSDNATGGAVATTADGEVWFFTQGRNSVPVYRIHGWRGWTRLQGTIALPAVQAHARQEGTGLTAAYTRLIAPAEPAGKQGGSAPGEGPDVLDRRIVLPDDGDTVVIEQRIWHGSPRRRPGHHEVIDGTPGPEVDWSRGIEPLNALRQPGDSPVMTDVGIRWSGTLEAPLSEDFIFSTYARGRVRLWLDGRQILFGWNDGTERRETAPIPLEAGRRYSLHLDFHSDLPHPACSLNWESDNFDRRRIATAYLYPDSDRAPSPQPDVRPATATIRANSFDMTSIPSEFRGNYTSGLRHRGLGVGGAWIGFERIDFGAGIDRVTVSGSGRAAGTGTFPVTIELRVDDPLEGPLLASIDLDDDAGHTVGITTPVTGVRDLYLVNATQRGWHFITLRAFRFDTAPEDASRSLSD